MKSGVSPEITAKVNAAPMRNRIDVGIAAGLAGQLRACSQDLAEETLVYAADAIIYAPLVWHAHSACKFTHLPIHAGRDTD